MKLNLLDRALSWLSPTLGAKRRRARALEELSFRAYDAAKTYASSDWISAQKTSANAEIGAGQEEVRKKSRDLIRNNAYAVRGLNVIVNNVVGAGIEATIKGRNARQAKRLTKLWKQVTESTKCDAFGRLNFRSLQSLAMRSVVEGGEVVGLKEFKPDGPKIRLLESEFLVSRLDTKPIVQGIELDSFGNPTKYHLYKGHPGDDYRDDEVIALPASEVLHVYRQDRPGQVRGISWFHAAIETLKDLADYQNATIIRQKIAACFGGFITTNDSPNLTAEELKLYRQAELQMKPGMFRYLNQGESVTLANPPGVDSYSEFIRETTGQVAAALGISREALTGDFSQVNFSSGRMGHIEFRRSIEAWRWNLLIPQFCDRYFEWFLEWAKALGEDVEGAYVEWTAPAHSMIDPGKEIAADKEAVLAGFKSRRRVIREMGDDPDAVEQEISEEREEAKKLGLKFDVDVASTMPVTNPVSGDDQNESNEENASNGSDPSGHSE